MRRRSGAPAHSSPSSSSTPGTVEASAFPTASSSSLFGLASPLVHEELLDLDGEHTGRIRERLVRPAGAVAAAEVDVLAHVERAAREVEGSQIVHEAVDHTGPPAAVVHGAGADVHLRVGRRVGRGAVRALAPVVVGMEVVAPRSGRGAQQDRCRAREAPRRTRRTLPRISLATSPGRSPFHTSIPQASSGVRYTALSRGRLRSTSKRERVPTTRVGPSSAQSPVNGSSSRRRPISSTRR